jgi:hypothetical protein
MSAVVAIYFILSYLFLVLSS